MNNEILQHEVICLIGSHPKDKVIMDKEARQFVKFLKQPHYMRVYRNGFVYINGEEIIKLDDSYIQNLFERVYQDFLLAEKAAKRKLFEEFKNG